MSASDDSEHAGGGRNAATAGESQVSPACWEGIGWESPPTIAHRRGEATVLHESESTEAEYRILRSGSALVAFLKLKRSDILWKLRGNEE
jgi:hypothetical protein